jgi:hypothetical protein
VESDSKESSPGELSTNLNRGLTMGDENIEGIDSNESRPGD